MFKKKLSQEDLISLLNFASESTQIGFWVWYPPEDVTYWDEKTYEILGYEQDITPSAENYFARIHPDDRELFQRLSAEMIESKDNGSAMDCRLQMPDGKIKHCIIQGTTHHAEDGTITKVIGFMQDRTDQIESNQEQLKMERLESINTLAQGLAHDFNNYLQMIQTSLNLINTQNEDNFQFNKLKEQLEIIERASTFSSDLITKMNTLAKGKNNDEDSSSHLASVIEELNPLLRSMLGSEIQFNTSIDFDGHINLSHLELNQVLINLIKNSKEAIDDKGNVDIKVFHAESHGDDFVCMQVIDNGSGIENSKIQNIFDPFYTTKRSSHGQGLGLASVFNILSSKGGVIKVESEKGNSTTFSLYLRTAEKPAEKKEKTVFTNKRKGNLKVLHVEDNSELRDMFSSLLSMNGHHVVSAENGLDGFNKFQNEEFDIIISDVAMPECDGPTMAAKIWKYNPSQEFIFLTGFHDDISTQLPDEHKDATVFVKPINMGQLLSHLLEISDSREAQAA